jgi:beta-mannosidase
MNKIFVLVCFIFIYGIQADRYTSSIKKWTFTIENDTRQYSADIPSTLSLDLIDNGVISDPYYRDNFLQYYNYETKDVSYKTQFNVPSTVLSSNHQYLIFEGLDTHAEVYLNGDLILSSHNMFRRYEVEVLFKASNTLVVNFTSAVKHDLLKEAEFKEAYQFSLPQNYSFSRKAAYQYGWDWGPRVLTVGIWKDVNILIYNYTRI